MTGQHPVERISSRSCPSGLERVRDEWLAYAAHHDLEPGVRYRLCEQCVGWHVDTDEARLDRLFGPARPGWSPSPLGRTQAMDDLEAWACAQVGHSVNEEGRCIYCGEAVPPPAVTDGT